MGTPSIFHGVLPYSTSFLTVRLLWAGATLWRMRTPARANEPSTTYNHLTPQVHLRFPSSWADDGLSIRPLQLEPLAPVVVQQTDADSPQIRCLGGQAAAIRAT